MGTKPAGQELDRLIAIDWSGRVDAAGQRRHIYAATWTRTARGPDITLEAGRTREELTTHLIGLARETPRMAVSIDCCFSYPAWFLEEHQCPTVESFWAKVAAGHGERWLAHAHTPPDVRFWGKPHPRPAEFSGAYLPRMMRATDLLNKIAARTGPDAVRAAKMFGITPKSPFQIGGSGSVGTGSLRAMASLLRLRQAGFRVWPFDAARLDAAPARAGRALRPRPLLLEMYTRLLTGRVAKSNPAARRAYLAARREEDPLYAPVSRAVLVTARGSEDAFDALVCLLEMVRHQHEFPRLRRTRNPTLRLEGITWIPGVSHKSP